MFDEMFIKEMSSIDAYNYGRQMMEKELNKLGECEYNKGKADALDIDMDKPMHFTDEQKAWIKKYIAINGERQRVDGAREFAEWLLTKKGFSKEWVKWHIDHWQKEAEQ